MSRARRGYNRFSEPFALASEAEGIFLERVATVESLGERTTRAAFEAVQADTIEQLRREREQARLEATDRLREERARLVDGDFEHVAPDVDPLGSARRLCQEKYPATREHFRDMVLMDARTTLYEAASKNGAELFPLGSLEWDGDDFVGSDGRAITDVTRRGLSAVSSREQQTIRVSEHVEAATPASLVREGLHHETGIVTIYPPTELQNQAMVRYSWFEEVDERLLLRTQQLSLPGEKCSRETIRAFFRELGMDVAGNQPGAAVQEQLLVEHSEVGDVATVGRYLDWLAGDELATGMDRIDGVDPYEQLAVESAMRQVVLEESAASLAAYCIDLAEREADPVWATHHVKKYVEQLLHDLSQRVPEIARRAFDDTTADTYRQASAVNDREVKQALYNQARSHAPEASYCGAGSCGLLEASGRQMLLGSQLGLKGSEFVYFPDGNCGECGTKGIIYDMEGNAACEDCKTSTFRRSRRKDEDET